MSLTDLFFIASVLTVFILILCVLVSAIRGRFETTRRLGKMLLAFIACYGLVLILIALTLPRRIYAAGERRCYDDWCVKAIEARPSDLCSGGVQGRTWIVEIEVSSIAKRIRQSAPDAHAELEDTAGRRYVPCSSQPGRQLTDFLNPDESFHVLLPFRLPEGVEPAGLVMHHGDIPGIAIIGADASFLHVRALQRLNVKK